MSVPRIVVLVAEDEPSDYELIELAIRRSKAAVDLKWVHDGAEARQYLNGEGDYSERARFPLPHVVIADLNMPRLTGHELIAWMRTSEAVRRTPVVVMSSSHHAADVDRAYEEGANAYFVKPNNLDALVELCGTIAGFWRQAEHPSRRS